MLKYCKTQEIAYKNVKQIKFHFNSWKKSAKCLIDKRNLLEERNLKLDTVPLAKWEKLIYLIERDNPLFKAAFEVNISTIFNYKIIDFNDILT